MKYGKGTAGSNYKGRETEEEYQKRLMKDPMLFKKRELKFKAADDPKTFKARRFDENGNQIHEED